MNALLITLFMIGLAFYLIQSKFLIPSPSKNSGLSPVTEQAKALPKSQLQPIAPVTAQSPHAISPDEAARQAEGAGQVPPQQIEPANITEAPEPQDVENKNPQRGQQMTVTSETSIRRGPSSSAELLGTAHSGAKLRVETSEAGWVEFLDPSANKSGWVSLADLAPAERKSDASALGQGAHERGVLAVGRVAAPQRIQSPEGPRPKQAQTAKSSPQPAAKVRQLSPRYAELPSDREFMPPRRGGLFGLFWKRRVAADQLPPPPYP
jgi:hypothetical protein